MARAKRINYATGRLYGHRITCPACNNIHLFVDSMWKFNGNLDKPTFTPSMLSNKDLSNPAMPRCHSFVTDGKIKFLGDCTHDMKGQTVDLPEIEETD